MTQKDTLLAAALPHVPFDGWSDATLIAAAQDCDISEADARALFPRGALDLALAYHQSGDAQMLDRLTAADLDALRFRDRIATGVRLRLEVADKDLVRRGLAFFALPQNAGEGSAALWHTCGLIWEALGDSSTDLNWYTKRATLSAVYTSVVLFWLGDESDGNADTWAFLDRRIDDVMQIEKIKGAARANPLFKAFMSGPGKILDSIKAPGSARAPAPNYPGHWSTPDKADDTP